MAYEHILTETEDGVGIITLNRPEKLNAMNRRLSHELHTAVKAMEADPDIGCIVVTGAGERAFSAGGDIHEQLSDDARYTQEELDAMRSGRPSYDISACAKPIMGMMNGLAYGGAASLPNQIGWPIAKELLFTARVVEAEEAWRIGLLNHLVPRAQLRAKTMEIARTIAGNHRGAVMGVKALLLQQLGESLERQWQAEHDYGVNVLRGAKAADAFPDFIARKIAKAG